MKLRSCVTCQKIMEVPKNSSRKYCEVCVVIRNNQKAKEHYARIIANGKVLEYREKARERSRERDNDTRVRLLKRAKARQPNCSLRPEDIVVPDVCPALKTPFVRGTYYTASLDKIDPSGKYEVGNIQVLSHKANAMKNSASREELIDFAKWVMSEYDA